MAATIVGEGRYQFKQQENWAQLPEGWTFGMIAGAAVDSRNQIYVIQRKMDTPRRESLEELSEAERAQVLREMAARPNTPSVLVFDSDGNYLTSWDYPGIGSPHTISIDAQDHLYISDRDYHVVMKFSTDGKLLLELGVRGQPSDTGCKGPRADVLRPGKPFNVPGKCFAATSGDLYVADGDRNCRIHKFSASGELLASWGTPGHEPGQLHEPHSVWVDKSGLLYVCDRGNGRVQVFTGDGKFIALWPGFERPTDIYMDAEEMVYIADGGKEHQLSILDRQGKLHARWKPPGAVHGFWGDAQGNIYAGAEQRKSVTKYERLN